MKALYGGGKSKYWLGSLVWPSQELANKNGEIEPGIVSQVFCDDNEEFSYDVVYQDGHLEEDVAEKDLSSLKPFPPNPNELLKKLI